MAYLPSINQKWCKKCGLCIYYCPKKIYDADDFGAPVIARAKDCIGCCMCEKRCPDFAISVEIVD
jgi:2-oxoglutarate ferredoxin oxidoreductase subunit delta